jgi:hypothetical protein
MQFSMQLTPLLVLIGNNNILERARNRKARKAHCVGVSGF